MYLGWIRRTSPILDRSRRRVLGVMVLTSIPFATGFHPFRERPLSLEPIPDPGCGCHEHNRLTPLTPVSVPMKGASRIRCVYDLDGHLTQVIDEEGNRWSYQRWISGDHVRAISPNGTAPTVTYHHDQQDPLSGTGESIPEQGASRVHGIRYSYDEQGCMTQAVDELGRIASYQRSTSGERVLVSLPDGRLEERPVSTELIESPQAPSSNE